MPRLPSVEDFGGAAAPRPSRQVTEHRPGVLDRGTQFLSDFGEMVQKETERVEKIAVEDALNKLRERRVDLTIGQDKGFQHVRGGAVIARPVLKEFPEAFGREVETIASGLTSSRARQLFQQRASGEATGFRTDLLRHVAAQTDTFQGQVFEATVKVESGYAASMYSDPVAVEAALQRVETAAADETVRLGITDSKLRQLFTQQTSGAVIAATVQGALAGDDSETALAIYEQYKDKLSETQRRGLDSAVKSATSWDRGQRLAEEAFTMQQSGVSSTKVEKFLIDKTRGSKDTYSNAQAVLRQLQGARKEQQSEAAEAAQDAINRGAPWQKIRGQYLGSMSPAAVAAFDRSAEVQARGGQVTTDLDAWDEITTRLTTDADAFRATDLNEYRDRLSPSDYRRFREAQLAPPQQLAETRTLVQQVTDAELSMASGKKRMTPAQQGEFREYVFDRIRAEEAGLGRKLSEPERETIIRRATTTVEKRFWGPDIRAFQRPEVVTVPSQREDAAPITLPPPAATIPATDRQLIIDAYKLQQNRVPSEAEIRETYNRTRGAQ